MIMRVILAPGAMLIWTEKDPHPDPLTQILVLDLTSV